MLAGMLVVISMPGRPRFAMAGGIKIWQVYLDTQLWVQVFKVGFQGSCLFPAGRCEVSIQIALHANVVEPLAVTYQVDSLHRKVVRSWSLG
jgi:hypothetical protein